MINDGAINNSATIDFVLNKNMITNCLTHIPQDIKLELNNGKLTLKAGSKIWIPYGTTEAYKVGDTDAYGNTVVATSWDNSKFFYSIELQSDLSYTYAGSGNLSRMFFWMDGYLNAPIESTNISGSATPSETTQTGMFYNTTDNYMYRVINGSWTKTDTSLPFSILSSTNGVFTSIDKVFNGLGYIGSTVFALPGVKVLIPNGRNSNESLKNIEFVIPSVTIRTSSNTYQNTPIILYRDIGFQETGDPVIYSKYLPEEGGTYERCYVSSENQWYFHRVGNPWEKDYFTIVGYLTKNSGVISNFRPYSTFQAVDYNDYNKTLNGQNFSQQGKTNIIGWGAPNYSAGVSVSSGYKAPTDGVITVRASGNNRTSNVSINGVQIFSSNWDASYGTPDNAEYRIGAGQKITLAGVSCTFYPLLGA